MNKSNVSIQPLSPARVKYLEGQRHQKFMLIFARSAIFVLFIGIWELAARFGLIDTFITSSPSRTLSVIIRLWKNGELFYHLGITLGEVLTGFLLGSIFGTLIAAFLWLSPFWSRVLEPYLVVINSLPKIALGPLFIVWLGAGPKAIIGVTLSISLIVTVLEVLNGFVSTDAELLKLSKSLGATRFVMFKKVVLPHNIPTILAALKISVGMSWVGVIVGEFLVSRGGIGYLIVYGSQVFQLDLVMAGVVVLAVAATLMYLCVAYLEKKLIGGIHL